MNHANTARSLRAKPAAERRSAARTGMSRFAWYRSATRPADAYLGAVIDELLPTERSAFIPGVMGFVGCYVRQLLHGRRQPVQAAVVCNHLRRRG